MIGSGAERVVLLGGYILERVGEDRASAVEVSEPIAGRSFATSNWSSWRNDDRPE